MMLPSPRTWARRLIIPLAIVWLLIISSWMVLRGEQIGGRPLIIVWSYDPGNYDPHVTSHPIAESIFHHVCEPLFHEDFDGRVRGLLAEDEIEYENDGRRITVQLRVTVQNLGTCSGFPTGAAKRHTFGATHPTSMLCMALFRADAPPTTYFPIY